MQHIQQSRAEDDVNTTKTTPPKRSENGQRSRPLKFELVYCFKAFANDFDTLQPIEIVKNDSNKYKDPVFLFPGFEGKLKFVQELVQNLNRTVYCLQFPFEKNPTKFEPLIDVLFPLVKERIQPNEKVKIIAHSMGGLVALQIIKRLELENKNIRLCLIDSSPFAIKDVLFRSFGDISNKPQFENDLLVNFLEFMKIQDIEQYRDKLDLTSSWETKMSRILESVPEHPAFSKADSRAVLEGTYHSLEASHFYDDNFGKLNAETTLIRTTTKVLPFPDDFEITKYFKKPVKMLFVDGHHFNVVKFQKTADLLNEELEM